MSDLSEAIYAFERRIEDVAELEAEQTIERLGNALLASIKALWDENTPEPDMAEHDYDACSGARYVLARLCKDFDLEHDLLEHDEDAERYL